jgi:leader peptidase (prepilin peptidase)/N-methyltransferase
VSLLAAAALAALVVALVAGPLLCRYALQLAAGYRTALDDGDPERDLAVAAGPGAVPVAVPTRAPARPGPIRVVVVTAVLAALLTGAGLLLGLRPGLAALVWTAGAAVVLAQVDLAVHRLPDRVVFPSLAVVAAAWLADAVVLGSWEALLRAVLGGLVVFAAAVAAALISPGGMGFGDVKLLGLLGLVLGWFGWSVLGLGVVLGFLVGALGTVVLLVLRRAGWRTEVALGPSLLLGASLALASVPV